MVRFVRVQELSDQINLCKVDALPDRKSTNPWSLFDVRVTWILTCQYMSHRVVKTSGFCLTSQRFPSFWGSSWLVFTWFIQCCPCQWHHGHKTGTSNPQMDGSEAGNGQPIWDEFWHIHPGKVCKLLVSLRFARKHSPFISVLLKNILSVIRVTGPFRE